MFVIMALFTISKAVEAPACVRLIACSPKLPLARVSITRHKQGKCFSLYSLGPL